MVSSFDKTIDIAKLKWFFQNKDIGDVILGKGKIGWKIELKPTTFYNQITLVYNDKFSTKSIKIFPNGSLQVAGCSDLFDCRRIIKQLAYLFELVMGDAFIPPLETFKIVMINSNFSLNYSINLRSVSTHFSKYPDIFKVSFEPDRYSAVKVKFQPAQDMKEITTSIFGTGKIIITGAETLKEIAFAYNIINHTINSIPNVRVKQCDANKMDLFDDFSGYKIDKVLENLKMRGYNSWKLTTKNRQINF
tara:strand:+ start:3056 stop:3799 length:744 start_codon:yes stop_codon:yes gene_type:complete